MTAPAPRGRWVCRKCGHGFDTHIVNEKDYDGGVALECLQCECALLLPGRFETEWRPKINADVPTGEP